ncbi:MAG TPA: molybdopterin converting factor subunit 1 [Longimicrobiales bacterium]|nr:molybdopterin converting factor subunit 1 [Longimicrobiales bacterium]
MRVRVLLFALYRDLAGAPEIEIEVPAGATARDAVRIVRGRGPAFERLPDQPAIAVNEVYANLETVLSDGDEVALIPPVAGG